MSTIEDRLRDAMAARARTVPDDGLDHALPPPRRTRPRGLAIAAAALAVAGPIVGVARLAQPSPDPREAGLAVMSLSGAAATSVDVSVYLCDGHSPFVSCKGGAATDREKGNIRRALQARPDVRSIVFEDRRTAFENFRRMEKNSRLLEVARVEDMPESFRIKVAPGADPLAVVRAVKDLPGVSNVIHEGCGRDDLERASAQCVHRGRGR
ncbi:permease-like cell division protein FtsX [Microbispora sp. NPDC049633]|uniref:permease-like cell division protein FtsX n=1 Tax=Microbispora sp. NPDC049633 TaxID=3154355 RepID=UPI003412B715